VKPSYEVMRMDEPEVDQTPTFRDPEDEPHDAPRARGGAPDPVRGHDPELADGFRRAERRPAGLDIEKT
jgi:hypothetical protein